MKTSIPSLFTSAVTLTWFLQVPHAAAQEAINLATDVSGTISAAGEADWYSVTTEVLGDLVITQTAWPPFIETRIELYGPGDQTTLQANTLEAAAPGVYYIKVYSANNGTSTDVYTFNATLTPAATGNDRDGGGNAASAAIPTSIGTEESGTIGPSSATAGVQDEETSSATSLRPGGRQPHTPHGCCSGAPSDRREEAGCYRVSVQLLEMTGPSSSIPAKKSSFLTRESLRSRPSLA